MHSPLFSGALQTRLSKGLCLCKYTYGDLLFIQACSKATEMQCITSLCKTHSPLLSGALQTRLTEGLCLCKYYGDVLFIQAGRQRSRSLERSSSEDVSDSPHMPTASAAPVGSPQSPDQAPEPNQAALDSYVSPEAHASVLTGSSKDFAGYLMSLQMRQRCTVVAYIDRGALCIAVATAVESSAGLMQIH
ncbi:TPA: hypothetical protein ACH3X3_012907 [Trebouxia sp. C0006]